MSTYPSPEEQVARAEAARIQAEAHRDAAINIAANQVVNRDIAEIQAEDARIAAGQARPAADEIATDRRVLRNELASERVTASNNAFGFYLTLGVLLAAILIGGFYLFQRNQNPDNPIVNAAPSSSPPPTVVVTPNQPAVAPSPPPVTVNTPSPVVNVTAPAQNPPEVNNRVNATPPGTAPSGSDGTTSGTSGGTSETNNGARGAGSGDGG